MHGARCRPPFGVHYMRISTIVLNWNRQALLEQTLRSYAATVVGPCELMVIDNASSDGSP